jgi:selenocysteine-specific elongation factor
MEHPFILGTAGHIDHGKTALVRAITGVDCDRLGEEKRRGITIELGFAPLRLASKTVSIIDVPGHERFIRHMVAGAAGIDAVMLVVAADEGVMPQTREHLDILGLLGVEKGIVVLSKSDLVSDEMLDLARDDVLGLVKGTFLDGAPVVPVSAQTGDGIAGLLGEIEKLSEPAGHANASPQRRMSGAFFMPIDRAFSMRGFGSVVTGTSYQGSLSEGDEVDLLPSTLRSKVRSIQIHGEPEKTAAAGQRVAINLSSISLEQLKRGDVICAKGRFEPTTCIDAVVEMLPCAAEPLEHWQRVRLHVGTADTVARVSFPRSRVNGAEAVVKPGERGVVQLLTEAPIGVATGQRFVIRFYSPLVTIGGGKVLMANATRPHSRDEREEHEQILLDLDGEWSPQTILESLARVHGIVTEPRLFRLSQMEPGSFKRSLDQLKKKKQPRVVTFGPEENMFISVKMIDRVSALVHDALDGFHRRHPELAGVDADEIRSAVANAPDVPAVEIRDFYALLDLLVSREIISKNVVGDATKYAAAGFEPKGDDKFAGLVGRLRAAAVSAGFELVETAEMTRRLGASPSDVNRAIGYLREKGDLRIVGENLIFPRETRDRALDILNGIDGDITIATFRDALGTSRKYALAILEFFDSNEITRRVGDKRVLLKGAAGRATF